jgi:hypothetical protein
MSAKRRQDGVALPPPANTASEGQGVPEQRDFTEAGLPPLERGCSFFGNQPLCIQTSPTGCSPVEVAVFGRKTLMEMEYSVPDGI